MRKKDYFVKFKDGGEMRLSDGDILNIHGLPPVEIPSKVIAEGTIEMKIQDGNLIGLSIDGVEIDEIAKMENDKKESRFSVNGDLISDVKTGAVGKLRQEGKSYFVDIITTGEK